jgi:RNA-directed DNA polymerase
MEEVVEGENLRRAWKRVKANQGSPGVDGMTVFALKDYLNKHWPAIREQLLMGTYQPQPVQRVEIEKPEGGMRKLGIPTVVDRFIQQAVMQVLQNRWDRTFSDSSYGFRPGRSAHQAVARAQQYIAEGFTYVVDLDLEKFFDRVNHDKLMGQIAKRVEDKRLLKLIRAFLNAGVMENGLVSPSVEGTPQGGPLSPLLSNLVLDELDREMQRRGHRFVRYADDCNIYVRSERAGQRVMESVTNFISTQLKLKVNREKSAVAKPQARKFLGFSFTGGTKPKRRIASKARERFPRQGPGNHAREEGAKYAAANRGSDAIPARVAWLLWFLRNSFCAGRAGFVGPEAATLRLLDRVEDGASAVRCSVSLGHLARAGGQYRRQQPRSLVPESEHCFEPGAVQRSLRLHRPSATGSQSVAQPAEPPYTDPYVRWCDRESE